MLGDCSGCDYYNGLLVAREAELSDVKLDRSELEQWIDDLQSGMYINCVYCGFRYGPKDKVPSTMADALKEHIEQCPKHPMSKLKNEFRLSKAENEAVGSELLALQQECIEWKKKYEDLIGSEYGIDTC